MSDDFDVLTGPSLPPGQPKPAEPDAKERAERIALLAEAVRAHRTATRELEAASR